MSNVTTAPSHSLSGRDSVGQPDENKSSLTDTFGIAEKSKVTTTNYSKRPYSCPPNSHFFVILLVYYQIYTEDGPIPSKLPATPGNPFVGRIKARSVLPPRTVKAVKRNITKVENIKDGENTSLFLTHSKSPMDDTDMVTFLNGKGPGSTAQEPLALVAKLSDFERSILKSDGRSGLASATEPDKTSPEIRYGSCIQPSLTFLFVKFFSILPDLR